MSLPAAIKLVHSLSKSEKRHFKLSAGRMAGSKDYLDLFDLIDQIKAKDRQELEQLYRRVHPSSSPDNASRYLLKVLSDCLVQLRVRDDHFFELLHGLQRVHILQERNLPEEGYRELKRLQQLALHSQDHMVQYMIYRQMLNFLSENNFDKLSEKQLVGMQMKARDLLRGIRNTHEHYSLYELLKYRLVHSGKALSEEDRKQLTDLLLSEMSIVNAREKSTLESRKLHLLFQSFFFTDIGDYRSALKTFYELNRLFERNRDLWRYPPSDYLSALDGILDSLRTMGYFDEMPYYIQKLQQLEENADPEYFRLVVRKLAVLYQLVHFVGMRAHENALQLADTDVAAVLSAYSLVDDTHQHELLFYTALAYFRVKQYKKAQKYLNEIVLVGEIDYRSMIYKASRLLSMLIHYEDNNLEYLDYEVRSYKRALQHRGKSTLTEKLVFKTIKLYPTINTPQKNEILWKKVAALVKTVEKEKYELQLLKYFDFIGWVKAKFGR
jgi:hypothetical protein